jgi:hypothetical protein
MKIATFPTIPYLAQTTASNYDQNTTTIITTTIPQDERLQVTSHLIGWKTTAQPSSLSHKIIDHTIAQHIARWKT